MSLSYTLVSDGSSDRMLLPLLDWLLSQHSARPFRPQWADLAWLQTPPRTLADRVGEAMTMYPCDVVFVHRDAEGASREDRRGEIESALSMLPAKPGVPVIPVRMTEAWFLFDEAAVREAAGNPNGHEPLSLPSLGAVESLPDPKAELTRVLECASGLSARRLKRFRSGVAFHRLATLIDDFTPLRVLCAFQALEADVAKVVQENAWG